MALCKFPYMVKYGGVFYAPNTVFEVDEKDVKQLVAIGAQLVPQTVPSARKTPVSQEQKPVKRKPYKIPPASKE